MLLGTDVAGKRCGECGCELKLDSDICPLCGAAPTAKRSRPRPVPEPDIDRYQSDVRKLREELKRLRDAEAS